LIVTIFLFFFVIVAVLCVNMLPCWE